MNAYLISAGAALPERAVTNRELAPMLGVSRDWIEMNSGIRERRWVAASESASDLAARASQRAIENSGRSSSDIDYLIASTLSPDLQVPGIGSIVHHKLGLALIPAVDLRAACSSILYSLQISRALIESGAAGLVLSCAAEAQSRGLILDSRNAEISMLFGDGAGAFITASAPRPGACNLRIDDVLIETDGCFALDLCVKSAVGLRAHASRVSVTANAGLEHAGLQQDEGGRAYTHFPVMNGRVVILQAVRKLTEAAVKLLGRNGMKAEDINLIVPHQANLNLLNAVAKRLSVPMGRVAVNLDRYGNTSSASAFIALSDAWQQGRLIAGGKILFLAFGAGFTWGAALCTCV